METLTASRLNRALLARQLLLERARLPIPAALSRLGGIQNQYAPNAYLRLWSCLDGFRRDDLTDAYGDGTVVQGTLMRGTIHAVAADDYHPMLAAIAASQRAWARRVHRGDDDGRATIVGRVRAALRGRSLARAELMAHLDGADPAVRQTIDTDAELLRVPPSGTWERRRADRVALADDVIGRHDEVAEPDGIVHLVRRYLAGFGPASAGDVASFTGLPATTLRPVLASVELRRFRDEAGGELIDLPDAPLPDAGTPAPVRFLPTWDAVLLVHARRTQVLPEAYRPRIFHTKMPPSYPTFLVDGQVAGTWRFAEGRVDLDPFHELPTRARRALADEAERLAAFHA
jgi:hypothetical protein